MTHSCHPIWQLFSTVIRQHAKTTTTVTAANGSFDLSLEIVEHRKPVIFPSLLPQRSKKPNQSNLTMAAVTETSKIPSSCSQTESTVLAAPLLKVWSLFRSFAFEKIAPGQVTATEFETGGEGQVGSVVKMTYKDGTVWRIRVTEFSERNYTLAYELMEAIPAHNATSVQGEIKLLAVTTDDQTFCSWTTDFSNDADLTVIADQKYKKREFFKDVKSNL